MSGPRFSLKPDTRFPHQQIYLRFTYSKGRHLRYYTGTVIPAENWDTEKGRAKVDRKFPAYLEINARLNQIEAEASRIAQRAKYNQAELSPESFKKELDVALGKSEREETQAQTVSFRKYFADFIAERDANPNYSKGSIEVYRTTFKRVFEYCDLALRRAPDFSDFNHAFFSGLTNFLYSKGFGNNYVNKLTSTLKTVLKVSASPI